MQKKQQKLNDALRDAVETDNAALVAAAVVAGGDPCACMSNAAVEDFDLIDYAAHMRYDNALAALITAGAKTTSATMQYVIFASDERSHINPTKTAQLCLAAGAPTDFENDEGTLLHQAATFNVPLIPDLLLRGLQINRINGAGDSALAVAIEMESDDAAVQLIDAGARTTTINGHGQSALHLAIEYSSPFVSKLITKSTVNVPNPESFDMPLIMALQLKKHSLARMLIAAGAGVNAIDSEENSALHIGIDNGSEIIKELLVAGADFEKPNRFGRTPLNCAIGKDYPVVEEETNAALLLVKAEIEAGIFDPKYFDDGGNSWLHLAATGHNAQLVEFLIDDLKLDHIAANNDGFTPVEMAMDPGIEALLNATAAKSAFSDVIAAAARKAKL